MSLLDLYMPVFIGTGVCLGAHLSLTCLYRLFMRSESFIDCSILAAMDMSKVPDWILDILTFDLLIEQRVEAKLELPAPAEDSEEAPAEESKEVDP